MAKHSFTVSPEDYPRPLNVMGDTVSVLARLAQTGSYAITIVHGKAGDGPPPHRHDWNETFFVVRGSVDFALRGCETCAEAGSLVHFPAGEVHSFTFGASGAELLEITGPGSRAVEMFEALDREIPAGVNDGARIAQVLEQNGVQVVQGKSSRD
uniref:cupin domain-containing protein n=1 Tax=Microbulbifer agarilyticus TaxID=260552 RepID=UPI0004929CC7|nr:cupin domain-containing protein [Microbulbifer agarilyticus]